MSLPDVERAIADVLARLSDSQVSALAAACAHRGAPPSSLGKYVAGAGPAAFDAVTALANAWHGCPGLTGAGVALTLRTGLSARRNAAAHRARPVWTGPGATGEQRLTAGVLHQLISAATERVLLVSYAAYTLPEVATDLQAAVTGGCCVDVVFETTTDSDGKYHGPKGPPFAQIPGINRWRWPAEHRHGGVLHAKLLVVDSRLAFVGSANLTHRALSANLEAGVLVRDPAVARELEAHVDALIADGVLERSEG